MTTDQTGSGKELGRAGYIRSAGRFVPILEGSDAIRRKMERKLTTPYQVLLFISDLLLVWGGFGLGFVMSGSYQAVWRHSPGIETLFILSLCTLSFFKIYHLYSYHHLFLTRRHLVGLLKAFIWGFLTLSCILFLFSSPWVIRGDMDIFLILLVAVLLMVLSRLYWRYLIFVLSSIGLGFLAVGIIARLHAEQRVPMLEQWLPVMAGFALVVTLVSLSRYFFVHVVFNRWLRRQFRRQVVIVGADDDARSIIEHIIRMDAPFWVSGFVGLHESENPEAVQAKRRLGEVRHLPALVKSEDLDEIIVTDENIDKATLISILDYCTSQGVTVWFPPKLMPVIEMKLFIDSFCGIPMIRLCSQKNIVLSRRFKHALDAVIGLPVLIVLLPLFALIAAAIRTTSPGGVFYRAKAIGRDGKPFTMFKFRSMRPDTTSEIHKEFVSKLITGEIKREGEGGTPLKIVDDPRITKVGHVLRKLSLDELPQILNVLKGDMSLVGPRPCLPYEFEIYKEWHKKRLSIRPGITGLWQVTGRSEVTFEEMVILDLYYIYNRSMLLDMNILYETIFVVLKKKGAF